MELILVVYFFFSIFLFFKFKNYFLLILIVMEFILLNLMMSMFMLNIMMIYILFFLVTCVCESVLGMSLMVMFIRFNGNDKLKFLNLILW